MSYLKENYLKTLVGIMSGRQLEYYQWQLDNAKLVKMSNSLDASLLKKLASCEAIPKHCFSNAAKVALTIPNAIYVEGYVSMHGVPIEHAWNRIGVVDYFDITANRSQAKPIIFDEYLSILEIGKDEVVELMAEEKLYGNWMSLTFRKMLEIRNMCDVIQAIADEVTTKMICDEFGSCIHFAKELVLAVAKKNKKLLDYVKVVEGYVDTEIGEGCLQIHTFVKLADGRIIDPTIEQFLKYDKFAKRVDKIKKEYLGRYYLQLAKRGSHWALDRKMNPSRYYKDQKNSLQM